MCFAAGDESRAGGQSDLAGHLAELLDHGCGHVVHGHHAGKFVRVGEEIAFERVGAGSDVCNQSRVGLSDFQKIASWAEAGGFDGAGDVEHGVAFGTTTVRK